MTTLIILTLAFIFLFNSIKPQPLQFRDAYRKDDNFQHYYFYNNKGEPIISIIFGKGSFGYKQGLYEMWDLRNPTNNEYNEPQGYMSIDDINNHLTKYPI